MKYERTSKEETEAHKDETHYRIYHMSDGKDVTDIRFWASDDAAALVKLEEYKSSHEGDYYFGSTGYFLDTDENGKEVEYDLPNEPIDNWKPSFATRISMFFGTYWRIAKDYWYAFRDFLFWFKHYNRHCNYSYDYSEYWSLDHTIIRKILFNLPRLQKYAHGCPNAFAEKAKEKLRDPSFDKAAFKAEHPDFDEKCDSNLTLGMHLWREELGNMLLYTRLYCYYSDFGIVDDNDEEMRKIDSEYSNTIPRVKGTFDSIDYKKLDELTETYWNKMWDWWRVWGRACWD